MKEIFKKSEKSNRMAVDFDFSSLKERLDALENEARLDALENDTRHLISERELEDFESRLENVELINQVCFNTISNCNREIIMHKVPPRFTEITIFYVILRKKWKFVFVHTL